MAAPSATRAPGKAARNIAKRGHPELYQERPRNTRVGPISALERRYSAGEQADIELAVRDELLPHHCRQLEIAQ